MKPEGERRHERDLAAYNQNVETFRSLNTLMWQIPLIAMTLTGGLWFGVAKVGDDEVFKLGLLALALAGNVGLIIVLGRLRYIMSRYLGWLRAFNPEGHVSAEGATLLTRPRTVRTVFQLLLGIAAITSGVLMLSIVQKEDAGNGSLGSVPYYDRHAEQLADGYEGVAFEAAHPQLAALLRTRKGLQVLDVGSGTGRDAAWMARAGHRVTAVEPSTAMRALARRLHPDAKVDWRAGALPDLSGLGADARYDVVLASAVWMHVAPSHRPAAMKRLAGLLGPDGTLFITLRDGPSDPARSMHATSADEVEELGRRNRLKVEHLGTADDLMGRSSIRWHMLALRRS